MHRGVGSWHSILNTDSVACNTPDDTSETELSLNAFHHRHGAQRATQSNATVCCHIGGIDRIFLQQLDEPLFGRLSAELKHSLLDYVQGVGDVLCLCWG